MQSVTYVTVPVILDGPQGRVVLPGATGLDGLLSLRRYSPAPVESCAISGDRLFSYLAAPGIDSSGGVSRSSGEGVMCIVSTAP